MAEADSAATPNPDAAASPLVNEGDPTPATTPAVAAPVVPAIADPAVPAVADPTATTDWRSQLSEDLAKDERLKDVDDLNKVVKSYLDRPQVPETYTLPDKYPYEGIVDVAKKSNWTQKQLDEVIEYQASEQQKYSEKVKSSQQTELAAYKKEQGTEWNETVRLSRGALTHFDGDGKLREFLRVTGAGQIPLIIDLFAQVGKILDEDGLIKGDADPTAQPKSQAKIMFPDLP